LLAVVVVEVVLLAVVVAVLVVFVPQLELQAVVEV
jgi:hypothetical protein